jgi:hypothetical protein
VPSPPRARANAGTAQTAVLQYCQHCSISSIKRTRTLARCYRQYRTLTMRTRHPDTTIHAAMIVRCHAARVRARPYCRDAGARAVVPRCTRTGVRARWHRKYVQCQHAHAKVRVRCTRCYSAHCRTRCTRHRQHASTRTRDITRARRYHGTRTLHALHRDARYAYARMRMRMRARAARMRTRTRTPMVCGVRASMCAWEPPCSFDLRSRFRACQRAQCARRCVCVRVHA